MLLISQRGFSTNHYISATGNDGFAGTIANPWQSIAKVNSMFSSFAAGDSILFKSGDTFRGSLIAGKSGTAGNPIVIASYGVGAKPIISGLTTLTGWTNIGTNKWQCNAATLKKNCNVLTINEVPQAVGRTGWMTFQSATPTQLTSSSLTGTPSYVGAEIVLRPNTFVSEKLTISFQAGSTVTYINNTQPINNGSNASPQSGKSGNGFFLQRFAGSLDTQGEWYYDKTAGKMNLYSVANPSTFTVKASYIDTVINLNNKTNITVINLSIEGAGLYGVESYGASNITIKNCDFNNNTKAVYIWNSNDATVDGNNINNSFNGAVMVSNNQAKRINVNNNVIHNTGQLIGMGVYNNEFSLRGIVARTSSDPTSNYVNIINNQVFNTGNGAIQFQGSNVLVQRNLTDTFCNQLDDNGGIYTFINNQSTNTINYVNRVIDQNIISNAIGAPLGSSGGNIDVAGFYMDDQTLNIVATNNTISNIPGNAIQLNNPKNITLIGNTVFNSSYAFLINVKQYGVVSGIVIKKNIFYPQTTGQYILVYTNSGLNNPPAQTITNALKNFAYLDSNYYRMKKVTGFKFYYSPTQGGSYTFPSDVNLANWRSTYLHDQATASVNVDSTGTLVYNASGTATTTTFTGFKKKDAYGNNYTDATIIPPWSSIILINNGFSPVSNTAPVSHAGSDQTITLPTSSVNLSGVTSTDAEGAITYAWSKISGPASYSFGTASASTTTFAGLVAGDYTVQLTVTDAGGLTNSDQVQVHVLPAPNTAPVARAGNDTTITLPDNTVNLSGLASSDAEGAISAYAWAKISGPATYAFGTSNASTTTFNSLVEGNYSVRLTVTDAGGVTNSAVVNVHVLAAPVNILPVANAGADKNITLPVNTVTVVGNGTDADGTIISYGWSKVSGPATFTIISPSASTTDINNLVEGTYQFKLTVTDNSGGTGISVMTVVVNPAIPPANILPVSNAGTDVSITLPTNTTTLIGGGTDADGTISSYAWSKVSGPATFTIVSPASATTVFNNLVQGVYILMLTVTDNNGGTGTDQVVVTVNHAINLPPVSNAGTDTTITLPANTVNLDGSLSTDADDGIASYLWTKVSGPATGTIVSPTSVTSVFNNLVEGVYTIKLRVTDFTGDTSISVKLVTVNPAPNVPPVANAGTDDVITLPVDSVSLNGTGSTDSDDGIATYLWSIVPGSPAGNIVNSTSATTILNNLVAGVYTVKLKVTDVAGDSSVSTKQVTVNDTLVNSAPFVQVSADTTIVLPLDSATIVAMAFDVDGTITSYAWVKTFGPASGTIASPDSATTLITGLTAGVYRFRVTVTDNIGATAQAQVQVTVTDTSIVDPGHVLTGYRIITN